MLSVSKNSACRVQHQPSLLTIVSTFAKCNTYSIALHFIVSHLLALGRSLFFWHSQFYIILCPVKMAVHRVSCTRNQYTVHPFRISLYSHCPIFSLPRGPSSMFSFATLVSDGDVLYISHCLSCFHFVRLPTVTSYDPPFVATSRKSETHIPLLSCPVSKVFSSASTPNLFSHGSSIPQKSPRTEELRLH